MGARYTEVELASVREMVAGGMTDGEIAERLGRTPKGIESARWIHGISRGGKKPQRRFSEREDEVLRSLAGRVPVSVLAGVLGRSESSVRVRARRLGIDPCMTNETMREYRAMKAAGRLGKLGEVAASVRR